MSLAADAADVQDCAVATASIVRPGRGSAWVGREVRQLTHAVLVKPWKLTARGPLKGVTRHAGQAVCGVDGPFDALPAELSGQPAISCEHCATTVAAEGIKTWEAAVIAIIGCGARKLPYAAEARQLYIGSYFRACLRAAEAAAPGRAFILSAKYGLLDPSTLIRPYDLTLGQPGAVGVDFVAAQAARLGVADERVIALCGSRYAELARQVWPNVETPLAGLGIGNQLHALRLLYRNESASGH